MLNARHAVVLGIVALALSPFAAVAKPRVDEPCAPTLNTICGAGGTGRTGHGQCVTRKLPREYVDGSGTWTVCPAWVADGEDPATTKPKSSRDKGPKDCPASNSKTRWGSDGVECSADPLPAMKHGEKKLVTQRVGTVRGEMLVSCDDGVVTRSNETCARGDTCDTKATIKRSGDTFSYDGRPKGASRPSGESVEVTSEKGDKVGTLKCSLGKWQLGNVRAK